MITCMECGKKLHAIQTSHFKKRCVGRIHTLAEYRASHDGAPIRSAEMIAKTTNSEAAFMKKWGIDEGRARWRAYCAKLAKKNTLRAFLENGKSEQEWKDYNASRAITLENMTKKYGADEGKRRFASYRAKQVNAGNTLSYFVEKHGEEEGARRYAEVCAMKGITLENMTRVHGREEGFIRYNAWLEKNSGNFISLSGSQFVKDIVDLLPSSYVFHDGVFGKEFCVWDDRAYMFDFVITHPVKCAVEFNGDFWHANPARYNQDDWVPLRGGAMKAADIWAKDAKKKELLEQRGFRVMSVWENAYLQDPIGTVKEVLAWITE